jgi:hypothetical protein
MTILFNPTEPGMFTANIAFQTDVDVAPGQSGDVYHLTLAATSTVPEPSTAALCIVPARSLLCRRKKIANSNP